ncbi:hypothetical protein SASPL_143815 [Salvia splendens]|uniref:Reverse transcriptase Ty1/copia-type domain-containing protein n=1 Tax=Salvia splendens TaxID=180675 RepID=A0A8X8WMR6_SALSN|nr:hypothetical protein SASPL_143815 [Salvia splendens]
MSHMHVPKYLWSDVVLTACFLINRMPSSVLHGDIPFSCLRPDKPLYHIPPRIFGCTCFVHDLTPGLDKLSPRSIKCVYTRRHRPATATEAPETVPTVSCPLPQSSSPLASEDPPPSDELPIAICKVISTSYQEALKHPLWRAAMDEEMRALLSCGTWILVHAPDSVDIVSCPSGIVILIVYVDDILISGSDVRGIEETKKYLQQHFVINDLYLLKETGLLGAKPVDTPMEVDPSVWDDSGEVLEDKVKYRSLVGKLIYLTVTRPDISFVVGLVSRFLDKPKQVHWDAAIRILQYVKKYPGNGLLFKKNGHLKIEGYSDADYAGSKSDRNSTSGCCTYLGGNLVTRRSKKQHTVARSSAEAECIAMAHTATEMIGVKNLLGELGSK